MEQAILKKDGKGWRVTFSNGKSLTLSWSQIPKEWDGATVEILRDNGAIIKIKNGEHLIEKQSDFKQKMPQQDQSQPHRIIHDNREPAKAPYNFVELNKKVVQAQNIPDFDSFYERDSAGERFSGYIDLSIVTHSPLFVRDVKESHEFFTVNGQPLIPGSSLRGMVRTLVEIVSFSKFTIYDNRTLYRRSGRDDKGEVFSGYLFKQGNEYKIHPAKHELIKDNNPIKKQFPRAHDYYSWLEENCDFFTVGEFGGSCKLWRFDRIINAGIVTVPESIIRSYNSDEQRDEAVIDVVQSANRQGIVNKQGKPIHRNTTVFNNGIPVFYRLDKSGEAASIGHAKYHRVPYNYNIAGYVQPATEHSKKEYDFAEAVFGFLKQPKGKQNTEKDNRKEFASRVFFEDATTEEKNWQLYHTPLQPKILASPKPTTYQHYLEQKPLGIKTPPSKLNNWNSNEASIRGTKLYWHRKTSHKSEDNNSWVEKEENLKDKNGKRKESYSEKISPVKPETTFSSHIRFENLTTEELGALLFVLQLPTGCCHKLGMGKPLGLGSVEITPTLTIIDRQKRYEKLFEGSNWCLGFEEKDKKEGKALHGYKNAFAQYIDKELHQREKQNEQYTWEDLWENDRLKQLKTMLTFEPPADIKDQWLERTRYMKIETGNNEYRSRPVLPQPGEVVKKDTYHN